MRKLTFKWSVDDGLLVACSGEGEMNAELWAQYISDLQTKGVTKVLGLNLGTIAMTSTQRKQASDIAKARGIISIIVTDDRVTRGIITAISWVGANIRAFPWTELNAAIKALNIPIAMEGRVLSRAMELRRACELEMKSNRS